MKLTLKDAVPTIDQVVNFGKSVAVKGRWRIDQDKPDGITYWAPRATPSVLEPHSNFAKDAKKFLQKLEGRQRVIFQVEAEGGTQTLTFDLAGLDTKHLSACYTRRDMRRYAFVDGNYLRTRYESTMTNFFGKVPEVQYSVIRHDLQAEKLFFYDALPESTQGDEQTVPTPSRAAELARIHRTAGCHVREGSVQGRKKDRGKQQKQVDVLLAVECLTHAFRHNCDSVVLITGDLDFKPLVDNLVWLGSNVEVWYDRKTAASELLDAADSRREVTLVDYQRWADEAQRRALRLPHVNFADLGYPKPDSDMVRRGTVSGVAFTVYQRAANDWLMLAPGLDTNHTLLIQHNDLDKLLQFADIVYGDVVLG